MRSRTFTLLELLLVIVILVALAAVCVPIINKSVDDARVAQALRLVDTLKAAVMHYYADTGTYNIEYGVNADPAEHYLSYANGVAGWKGPYITKPLALEDNPFNGLGPWPGYLQVMSGFIANGSDEFDLDGDGVRDTGNCENCGAYLRMYYVPDLSARKINDAIDAGVPNDALDWQDRGRVNKNSGILSIYLVGGR